MIKAIIEIQKGSQFKYEVNENGQLEMDRVIQLVYPVNYGYIPGTLELDGDPLDVFVISSEPIPHLALVPINIIGGFECIDDGVQDNKLIATVVGDLPHNNVIFANLVHRFLLDYKTNFVVKRGLSDVEALQLIELSQVSKT